MKLTDTVLRRGDTSGGYHLHPLSVNNGMVPQDWKVHNDDHAIVATVHGNWYEARNAAADTLCCRGVPVEYIARR